MAEPSGLFISLEGVEGAGKSTLADGLERGLVASGMEVVRRREPGGTSLGEAIRSAVLDPAHGEVSPWAELFLMLAARAQLVHEIVRPALERGAVVLCDRFMDASTAYQGAGRELGIDRVRELNALATHGYAPHVTFLLDLDPALGRARQSAAPDRMEREELDFHRRVRAGYLQLAADEPHRFVVLDAAQDAAFLLGQAWAQLGHRLPALPEDPPASPM